MFIERHIKNLKQYIEEDPYYNGTHEVVTDFDKYCYNHCEDIDMVLNELKQWGEK